MGKLFALATSLPVLLFLAYLAGAKWPGVANRIGVS